MNRNHVIPGSTFPIIDVYDLTGNIIELGQPSNDNNWHMVIIFRGYHSLLCTNFLNKLETYKQRLCSINIEISAVSADSKEQLSLHTDNLNVSFPVYYGLSLEAMQNLKLFISKPCSEQETDHLYPEPALFVINEKFQMYVIDISNNPFVRPDLENLISGLEFIKNPENDYPIRGTYDYHVVEF